jgi:hypothetical protein
VVTRRGKAAEMSYPDRIALQEAAMTAAAVGREE